MYPLNLFFINIKIREDIWLVFVSTFVLFLFLPMTFLDKHNPISKIQGRKWRLQNFEDEVFVSYLCTIPEWNRLPIPVAYANSIVHFETLVLPK